jgi:hypothetical protein
MTSKTPRARTMPVRDLNAHPKRAKDVRGGNLPIDRVLTTVLENVNPDATKDLKRVK